MSVRAHQRRTTGTLPRWHAGTLQIAEGRPILERLRKVRHADALLALKIRDRPRDAKHAMDAARGEVKLRRRTLKERRTLRRERAVDTELRKSQRGVGLGRITGARCLSFTGSVDTLPNLAGGFPVRLLLEERARRDGRNVHVKVNPVEQRPAHALAVPEDRPRKTLAEVRRIARVPAGTRIHRGDQRETSGKRHRPRRPTDQNVPVLERLPEMFEDVARELGELIEEQNAAVRERDFPRLRV